MYSQKPPQAPKGSGDTYAGLLKAEQDPITAGLVAAYLKKSGLPSQSSTIEPYSKKPSVSKRSDGAAALRNSGY